MRTGWIRVTQSYTTGFIRANHALKPPKAQERIVGEAIVFPKAVNSLKANEIPGSKLLSEEPQLLNDPSLIACGNLQRDDFGSAQVESILLYGQGKTNKLPNLKTVNPNPIQFLSGVKQLPPNFSASGSTVKGVLIYQPPLRYEQDPLTGRERLIVEANTRVIFAS